jgi:hypothetical protein
MLSIVCEILCRPINYRREAAILHPITQLMECGLLNATKYKFNFKL